MIDGGSSICTIRKEVVEREGLKPERAQLPLYAFGSTTQPAVVCNAKVNAILQVDGVKANVELWLVEEGVQTADVIVGRSYTEQSHVAYYKVGDSLVFGSHDDDVFKQLNERKTRRVPLTYGYEELRSQTRRS
uniref:Peptidase A2 domain-containing protein n=1 Tax=Photinus pyralis TaxID=7054 RepID=A0A1Y1MC12_PHOPY